MAIRKKLGNDPLARRAEASRGDASWTDASRPDISQGETPAALAVLSMPTGHQPPMVAAESPPQDARAGLAADLAALFPLPHFRHPPARKEQAQDDPRRCVQDELFRRTALSLPTVFGRTTFTEEQFADAFFLLVRETLLTMGLPLDALTLQFAPFARHPPLPRPQALLLLHGGFGAMQTLLEHGKLPREASLAVHLEPIAQTGEFMLRLVESAQAVPLGHGKECGHVRRLLDRDRVWPSLQSLGLRLARRSCRLFLFTATAAELRLIAPANAISRAAA